MSEAPAGDPPELLTITCLTDAGYSLFGDAEIPLLGAAEELVSHDAEAVKPALLYADKAVLMTGNRFVSAQLAAKSLRLTMPIPALALLQQLATEERPRLGNVPVPPELVPRSNDFVETFRKLGRLLNNMPASDGRAYRGLSGESAGHEEARAMLRRMLSEWEGAINEFTEWLDAALLAEAGVLESSELRPAVDRGVLSVRGHLDRDLEQDAEAPIGWISPIDIEAYRTEAALHVLNLVQRSPDALLLDRWAQDLIEGVVRAPARPVVDRGAELGLRLLAHFPALKNASIEEVLDLRAELVAPLARLRGAMVSAARDVTDEPSALDEAVRTLLEEHVQPALADIDEARQQNSYIKNLITAVHEPRDLVAPFAAVGVALASSADPLVSAIAGALGLAGPHLKAAFEMNKRHHQIRQSRYYLLHRLRSSNRG